MQYRNIISCLLLLATLLLASCQAEDLDVTARGCLRLNIQGISSETTKTRSTPAELKDKLGLNVDKFQLAITRQGYSMPYYSGKFIQKEMEIPVGTYDIVATYGENPLLGRNTPYYIGTTTATIEEDLTTEASLTCKVGNALVSVIFGENEAQAARFEKFYSSYKLFVHVGNYSMDITNEDPTSSIYLRAGSNINLSFMGTLREEKGRTVTCELQDESIPSRLNAGEHLIVTLTPDDTKTTVNIHKIEVKTVTLEETIPLSWLPAAAALPIHQYDKNGNLVGTNVTFTDAFPGMEWEAIVTNAEGTTVRGISGTGTLTSKYESNETWPYLPEGKYTANYYVITSSGNKELQNSREFIVHAPQLKLLLGGYSSYTKYLEGDTDAANECNANTIYEPSVKINISPDLLVLTKYNTTFTYNLNGTTNNITGNNITLNNITGLAPRSEAYPLDVSISFGGTTISDKRDFYITGLPIRFQPPTQGQGWTTNGSNNITFEATYVRFGGKADNSNQAITYNKLSIPADTNVALDYDVTVHPATLGTELTVKLGNQTILSAKESGGAANTQDFNYQSTTTLRLTSTVSSIECHNSYGSLDGNLFGMLDIWRGTSSYIYKLDFKYGE